MCYIHSNWSDVYSNRFCQANVEITRPNKTIGLKIANHFGIPKLFLTTNIPYTTDTAKIATRKAHTVDW